MAICAILAILSGLARADVVILRDGTRVEGNLKKADGGYDVTGADGKAVHVPTSNIKSIELGRSTSNATAMDRLASLKRSVESLDDLNQIISRFNAFIQQYKNTPAAQQAEKELAIWQERLDKQMVKVGGKWVSADQKEQMIAQSSEIVAQAQDLMKANRLKEAEPVIKQALEIDPTNPVANYLMGVLLFRGEKLVPARKAFEAAHAALPSDAATLNNIAVIAWRQNQFINAMGFYSDAMLAMPANKEILNNVAEALFALKEDFKKHPNAQRTSRIFIEQEAKLEAVMAQYGWYRWGSMWLDKNQLEELKKSEKDVKDKLDALQKKFDEQQQKFQDNQAEIARQEAIMNDIRLNSIVPDQNGNPMAITFPQVYYDAEYEIKKRLADNQLINQNGASLRDAAKRLEASKPKPKYTGVQQLIGAEGAPRIGGAPADPVTSAPVPTSQPVAAPTTAPPQPAPIAVPVPSGSTPFAVPAPAGSTPISLPAPAAPAPVAPAPAPPPSTNRVF